MTEQKYLKTEKIKDLANEISKIKTDIELMRATSEMFPSMDQIDKNDISIHYYKAYQYMSLLFMKFQDIEEDLENIGSILYAVDDYKDLKEFVREEDINLPEIKA